MHASVGENICERCVLTKSYTQNTGTSHITQQCKANNRIKNGQKSYTDTSQTKIHEWPINTRKDTQHHC